MAPHEKPHPESEAELPTLSSQAGISTDGSLSTPNPARDQTRTTVSRYLKDKEREWNKVTERKGPLTLLELPVDILRLIVKEITHTNDLTSLALTNSTLHNLAVPHIYARFDIVWPDGHISNTDSKSVDALTYGLSTLCLGSSFARTTRRLLNPDAPPLSRFTGNEYAKYTRKFSLGNGPNDWVAEYMITKESGKMLGTLVALAVAKMVSLETFVWDMPTGVLSDIFMGLASLPEHYENNECKLDRVWIRWHDNSENSAAPTAANNSQPPPSAIVPVGSTLTPIGILLPANAVHPPSRGPISYAEHRVEYPTFSVLPPLKSLTVLEIDELAYLDEMADLIARSVDRLQELRVGISAKAIHKDFAQTWDGSNLQQVDYNARWPGESTIGERRLGGVLGVLVGKIYDIRRRSSAKCKEKATPVIPSSSGAPLPSSVPLPALEQGDDDGGPAASGSIPAAANGHQNGNQTQPAPEGLGASDSPGEKQAALSKPSRLSRISSTGRKKLDGKMTLQTLELERVALSMHVCRYAIDWTVLSNITILDCPQHETLWKMLKKQYQPTPVSTSWGISATNKSTLPNAPLQYHLCMKRIHTDATSPALISFIKETLAPNSLEVLFLQHRKRSTHPPQVTIEQIFKGAVKRHRSSLRKLLIDSSQRPNIPSAATIENNMRWRTWVLPSDMVLYITSGRMNNLKELAVSLDYKDWHAFLQRLPNLPQLRSLNIPNIANHVTENFEPKELALQIADIITLRPEIQLCYVGISTKCFEILETRNDKATFGGINGASANEGGTHSTSTNVHGATDVAGQAMDDDDAVVEDTSDDDEDDDDGGEVDDGEETEEEGGIGDVVNGGTSAGPADPDETQSENSGGDDSDDDSFVEESTSKVRLRLREILFYDDKVSIFKARHGKL